MKDTIVAISTAREPAVRGVIRVSGPEARQVVAPLFHDGPSLERTSRGVMDGQLELGRSGARVAARLLIYGAPRSFTGEDVVELHVDGAPMLLAVLRDLLVRGGCRTAEPGEFTRRAYLNGRLDLSRAEAVLALIRARDETERRAALTLLEGGVERRVVTIRDRVLDVLVPMELAMDFSDQDVEIPIPAAAMDGLAPVAEELRQLASSTAERGAERSRLRVVLEGPANAGKSSLFNRLCGRDAALVTPVPGTTRDVITEEVLMDGRAVELVDTAGDDFTAGPVDREAHAQRRRRLREADVVIQVRDVRRHEPSNGEPGLLALTHGDLLEPGAGSPDPHAVLISNVTGAGLDRLTEAVCRRLGAPDVQAALAPVHVTGRQGAAFSAAHEHLARAAASLQAGEPAELVASDLHGVLDQLRQVTGEEAGQEVLDRVFRDFCIGK